MKDTELKALISLLDDEDNDVLNQVERKIISLGSPIIPYLEEHWERSFNPLVQKRIEDLIHGLQFEQLQAKLLEWKSKGGEDLLEGVWLLATYQYPDLDLTRLKQQVEQLYYEVWLEFKPDAFHYDQIRIMNSVFFSKLKFGANTKNFHSPGNSMINVVLETRKGNPITLSVIYMLIAQKLNMPVYGVNLPNLFILTYIKEGVQFYINPFNRGLIFSKEDIDSYIYELRLTPEDIYYQPCNNIEIVKRMMRNLIVAFDKLGDHYKAEEVKGILNNILGDGPY